MRVGTTNQITTVTITITTTTLPNATVGTAYSTTLAATGGTPPYTWTATGVPAGLTLASNGVLSGTPTTAGTSSMAVTAVGTGGNSSGPTTIPLSVYAAATTATPERIWRGYVNSTSMLLAWLPPVGASVTAYTYNVYRDGALAANSLSSGANVGPSTQFGGSYLMYVDVGLTPGTTHSYTVTAIPAGGGSEGPPTPAITITTPNGQVSVASPPTLPTAVADTSTWYVPYALPTGGTTWTATITTDNSQAGVPGTGAKNSVGCSFGYALANSAPGDIIVLTAGATYKGTIPSPNDLWPFIIPGYNGSAWVYIISSEDPNYKSGGALLPYAYTQQNQTLTPFTLTGTVAAQATSATLTAPWALRTAYYPCMFFGTDSLKTPSVFHALCTNGSTAISWYWPLPDGAQTYIGINTLPNVCANRIDLPNMPQIVNQSPGNTAHVLLSNPKKLRLVGIAFMPGQMNTFTGSYGATANMTGIQMNYSTPGNTPTSVAPVYVPPGDHVYFDRCYIGRTHDDTNFFNLGSMRYGLYGNCDHLLFHQTCFEGICSPMESTDNYCWSSMGGGPTTMRNCMLESPTEGTITGGSYVAELNIPHDYTLEYSVAFKPSNWSLGYNLNIQPNAQTDTFLWASMSPGERAKNHFENKTMIRGRYHGNLMMQNWMCFGGTGSQRGRAFANTAVSQLPYNPPNVIPPWNQSTWWAVSSDIDVYDNQIWNGGAGYYIYPSVSIVTGHVERIHFHNNTVFFNPMISKVGPAIVTYYANNSLTLPPNLTYPPATWPQTCATGLFQLGHLMVDVTVEHNTFLYNPSNPNTYNPQYSQAVAIYNLGASGTSTGSWGAPWGSWARTDRLLYRDNICDGVFFTFGDYGLGETGYYTQFTNSLFTHNVLVKTSAITDPNLGWKNVGYAGIGLVNLADNPPLHIPLPVTDWNLASTSTYYTAATDGTAVGATH